MLLCAAVAEQPLGFDPSANFTLLGMARKQCLIYGFKPLLRASVGFRNTTPNSKPIAWQHLF